MERIPLQGRKETPAGQERNPAQGGKRTLHRENPAQGACAGWKRNPGSAEKKPPQGRNRNLCRAQASRAETTRTAQGGKKKPAGQN